jgi:hypothetical protein
MGDQGLDLAFTDVLYGVVVANAIAQLEFGVTLANGMVLFAVAVVLDDWVDYAVHVGEASRTRSTILGAFVLDVAILVTWTLATLALPGALPEFLGLLAAVTVLQGVWDRVALGRSLASFDTATRWGQALAFVALAWAVGPLAPATVLLAGSVPVLVVARAAYWHRNRDRLTAERLARI